MWNLLQDLSKLFCGFVNFVSCISLCCHVYFSPSAKPVKVYEDFCSGLKAHADGVEWTNFATCRTWVWPDHKLKFTIGFGSRHEICQKNLHTRIFGPKFNTLKTTKPWQSLLIIKQHKVHYKWVFNFSIIGEKWGQSYFKKE